MPLISVILPTRDRPALLPRAVASVLAQTEPDFELVLVDNNSAAPVAQAHAGAAWLADSRVRLVRARAAPTAAAARNVGLAHATGTYIAYLDDDDAYRPGKLARQLRRMQESGSPLALCGARYHLAQRMRVVQAEAEAWQGDALLLCARWGTPFLMHQAAPLRFDEALAVAEDLEFALRLCVHFGVSCVPVAAEPLVEVYPQPGPRVNTQIAPLRRAAARVLHAHRRRFSRTARRRFLLQALLAMAKNARRPAACVRLSWRLLRESRGRDWRTCVNACAVAAGFFPGRWVS